jgi:hypothetical protein
MGRRRRVIQVVQVVVLSVIAITAFYMVAPQHM